MGEWPHVEASDGLLRVLHTRIKSFPRPWYLQNSMGALGAIDCAAAGARTQRGRRLVGGTQALAGPLLSCCPASRPSMARGGVANK